MEKLKAYGSSWDGKTGRKINGTDEDGNSTIISDTEIEFKDLNGDGIKEIICDWYKNESSDTPQAIIYKWNGRSYEQQVVLR
ncbi:MAG TPA: hypothetical protein VMT35_04660 [Ignavibacteriaceae bacterium]|nr:hypothetical protein [Ignavibacteriaceae bacterium]